ncbi:hypothetical protein P691DRAFT_674478 [Macrolepiota fuliginosa MF-IS2]|uniref:Uncharacterized protein n=1 Tax=Macrolepiota fuliginosa MF-IS2 TaxID=1400762 RepID=A0A9P5X8F7_9AGAR|nr:hypothetical protein P691DRAFT_674478 [Macrolepiota fuliginosa MF-IS2]
MSHQHQTRPAQPQQNNRPLARPSIPNRNENPNPAPSSSGESGEKGPSTPSMGGFHFPPGMNPLQYHNTNLLQGQRDSNRSGIGIKRPADAMSNSVTGGSMSANGVNAGGRRDSRPGMGLQQAAPSRREPFAPLDVGESGDVKRIKR